MPNVSLHIKNIFNDGELKENSVVKKLTTAKDGKNYKIISYLETRKDNNIKNLHREYIT